MARTTFPPTNHKQRTPYIKGRAFFLYLLNIVGICYIIEKVYSNRCERVREKVVQEQWG